MRKIDPIEFIQSNAGIMTTSEIAKKLGKTPNSVLCMAKRRGISMLVKDQSYTPEEDAFITRNINKLSFEDMSTIMSKSYQKRSRDSIRHRGAELGVSGEYCRKLSVNSQANLPKFGEKWKPEDDAYIVLIRRKILNYSSAAKLLKRTVEAVTYRYKKLDIKSAEYIAAEALVNRILSDLAPSEAKTSSGK